jgi:TetR/AcrR family transcriptional repressor of nem operon
MVSEGKTRADATAAAGEGADVARPKAFDEDAALEAAMVCFWTRGYQATSVRDLTEAMGIASPSLYNAFGDKRALFARSLERYCRQLTFARIERLEAELAAHERIAALLGEVIENAVSDPHRRGCFLINAGVEVAPHDSELGAVIRGHLATVRDFFRRCLEQSRSAGTMRADVDFAQSADHIMAVLLGLRVLARTHPERKLLESIVDNALAPLGLPSPGERLRRRAAVQ